MKFRDCETRDQSKSKTLSKIFRLWRRLGQIAAPENRGLDHRRAVVLLVVPRKNRLHILRRGRRGRRRRRHHFPIGNDRRVGHTQHLHVGPGALAVL